MQIAITVRNLYFIVKPYSYLATAVIDITKVRLTTYKWVWDYKQKRNVRKSDKIYLANPKRENHYHFNINMLKDFMITLGQKGISRDDIDIKIDRDYVIEPLDVLFREDFKLRDYQQEYEDILLREDPNIKYKLVDLATGKGKGAISIHALVELNRRTMLLLLPKYVDKWIEELTDLTDLEIDDIYVVQGQDKLLNLLSMLEEVGKEELPYKVIIITTNTMYNFIKEYENNYGNEDYMYPIKPTELTRVLGVGVVLNDETHQQFHSVFRAALFLDAKLFIGLSATLINNDKSVTKMYNIMFPGTARISNIVGIDAFVDTYCVFYNVSNIKLVQHKRPQGYNHNLYESSMMRKSIMLYDYTKMILFYLKDGYLNRRVKGDKCLIYVASINYATYLTNVIKNKYPKLDVRRYVEDDPYENVMDSDICVSTLLSASTGYDIKGLITVLNTVSVKSVQAIKQNFGRLRKNDKRELRYYYFVSKDINNHHQANGITKDVLKEHSKSYSFLTYKETIKVK